MSSGPTNSLQTRKPGAAAECEVPGGRISQARSPLRKEDDYTIQGSTSDILSRVRELNTRLYGKGV